MDEEHDINEPKQFIKKDYKLHHFNKFTSNIKANILSKRKQLTQIDSNMQYLITKLSKKNN